WFRPLRVESPAVRDWLLGAAANRAEGRNLLAFNFPADALQLNNFNQRPPYFLAVGVGILGLLGPAQFQGPLESMVVVTGAKDYDAVIMSVRLPRPTVIDQDDENQPCTVVFHDDNTCRRISTRWVRHPSLHDRFHPRFDFDPMGRIVLRHEPRDVTERHP